MTVGPLTWSGLVRGAARYGAPERSRSAAHAHSAPPPVGVTARQGGARAPSSGTSEEGASPPVVERSRRTVTPDPGGSAVAGASRRFFLCRNGAISWPLLTSQLRAMGWTLVSPL